MDTELDELYAMRALMERISDATRILAARNLLDEIIRKREDRKSACIPGGGTKLQAMMERQRSYQAKGPPAAMDPRPPEARRAAQRQQEQLNAVGYRPERSEAK